MDRESPLYQEFPHFGTLGLSTPRGHNSSTSFLTLTVALVVAGARANRAFLARVVRYLAAECGIR